ncbi:MAG: RNA polymerase sporulation sigma factor SigH [Butyrivibrio sp.]|nr:RNA polymerase sporulation sigma factor SigH [Butyrivibrio sp.]
MGKSWEDLSDEQLISGMRDESFNESDIMDFLMNKYKNLVRKKAVSMFILGADRDDLIQEGMIGLFKAIRDYDFGRDAGFATFAELCISRQMYSAIKASNRKKHAPLNSYISLYSQNSDSNSEGEVALEDVLESDAGSTPEQRVIDKEDLEALEKEIDNSLSSFERQVLDLYITGMSIKDISGVLGRDEKSTDNAMQRIKNKLRKYLKGNA